MVYGEGRREIEVRKREDKNARPSLEGRIERGKKEEREGIRGRGERMKKRERGQQSGCFIYEVAF